MKKKTILLACLTIFFACGLHADEGMWMLHLLKQQKLDEMKKMGLRLNEYDIYNPDGSSIKDAVVQFGGGCTGEVVSSQGLVLTNHHCGYGQIQNHSTLEHNYLENGFWAMSKAEELPNPGLTVTFIDKIEDVTQYVHSSLERDKEKDKDGVLFLSPSYLNKLAAEKTGADFLAKNPGYSVEIKPFFEGNQYFMFTKIIYSDIRLVAAPPSSIGKFGADTDNWMWPRHTGDFSVFRIYADKNGKPATYSPDNVPLKPKRWLSISTKGVKENDFAMILGFPGTTNKFYTSWEVNERHDIDNSVRIRMREVRQKAMLEEMLANPEVKIQYASKYSGSTNAYKSAIGSNWAIEKRNFENVKQLQQDRLKAWAFKNNKTEYIAALDTIESIIEKRADLRFRSWMLTEGVLRGIEFASIPTSNADSLLVAIKDSDKDKIKIFTEMLRKDFDKFADKDYNPAVDKKVAKAMLTEFTHSVEKTKQPEAFASLYCDFDNNVDAWVESIFAESIFGSKENFESFMTNPSLSKLNNDPMFAFAQASAAFVKCLMRAIAWKYFSCEISMEIVSFFRKR